MNTDPRNSAEASPGLPADLRDAVLERLGFSTLPAADLDGLGALYAAWCARVPFDNIRKMIALRMGGPDPLPGMEAGEFLDSWLRHGNGGTCWPTSNALYELFRSVGFQACRIAGAMRDLGVANHASVSVTIDGCDWLVDSSLLTNRPLLLGQRIFVSTDPVFPVEVEPVDGTHLIWFDNPPNANYIPCRLFAGTVDRAFYVAAYERSRELSPFNQRLYLRINRPREMLVLLGHTRYSKTAAGVTSTDLSLEELPSFLRHDLGIAGELLDAWIRSGSLDSSFQPPAGPKPPPIVLRPPSQR